MNPQVLQYFSPYPTKLLEDESAPMSGICVEVNNFCRSKFAEKPECATFYADLLNKPDGCYRCPFGLSACRFSAVGVPLAITCVIPLPRDAKNRNPDEDAKLKSQPTSGVERTSIEKAIASFATLGDTYASLEEQALRKLPHALHEIRKLNAIIKTESEALTHTTSLTECVTIHRASEFMSTQFDLLDLLINESIVELPVKKKVQLDALVHKCVKIFEIRADQNKTGLQFTDREAVWVTCCDKTLPIIVTILLDNAIRYSPEKTTVRVHVRREGPKANLVVENTGEMKLSPDRMYKKNERGITNIEGTGFGLYFAQKIAHQHGGELRCSTPKGRVVFTFSLPAKD